MINIQPISKVVNGDGNTLEVHSIFKTIQGEGPFTGCPAMFIRLSGCNLQCPSCDTEYSGGTIKWVSDIALQVATSGISLVVITGGEPFRQNITELVLMLQEQGNTVQIETNGTLPQSDGFPDGVVIVCSPKTDKVNKKLLPLISCYKYVLSSDSINSLDGLPISALGNRVVDKVARLTKGCKVYLQPLDVKNVEENKKNLEACIESCMKHGYTLQLQLHKIIGLE